MQYHASACSTPTSCNPSIACRMALGVCWFLGAGDADGVDCGPPSSGDLAIWEYVTGVRGLDGLRRGWRWQRQQQFTSATGACRELLTQKSHLWADEYGFDQHA